MTIGRLDTGVFRAIHPTTGMPLSLGTLHTYEPGTTTPKAAYQDVSGLVAHTNPISLNASGEAVVFLNGDYDILISDSEGTPVRTLSSVGGHLTPAQVQSLIDELILAAATGGWRGTWATGTAYTVGQFVKESGNVYICTDSHTSGTFATDLVDERWELYVSKGESGAGSGDLLAANNLSDVGDPATARANLAALGVTDIFGESSAASLTGLTEVTITGIPDWANRIEVIVSVAEADAQAVPQLQLGTSGGIQTSGYAGRNGRIADDDSNVVSSLSSAFNVGTVDASTTYSATFVLSKYSSGVWLMHGQSYGNALELYSFNGRKNVSGDLDRILFKTSAGTFTAGGVIVRWWR